MRRRDSWGCRGARTNNFAPEVDIVKKFNWLLCMLMAAALLGGTALAKEADPGKKKRERPARPKKDRRKKPKSGLRGEYAIMASELKLTDDQKAKLTEIIKAQAEARKANAPKAAELRKQIAEAKKAGDKPKVKELMAKAKELRGDPKANREKVMAILTDEQKAQWASFSVYRNVCRKFGRAKLTDDQKKAIRALCADAKLTGDRKADSAAMKSLTKKITADILTAEQRESMTKKKPPRDKKDKKDKPPRNKKPRPKKPADR